jgi:hypothetical protein
MHVIAFYLASLNGFDVDDTNRLISMWTVADDVGSNHSNEGRCWTGSWRSCNLWDSGWLMQAPNLRPLC